MTRQEKYEAKGFNVCKSADWTPAYQALSIACDQCEALVINGTPCHETGCPKSLPFDCFECGCEPVKYRTAVCASCQEND